MLGATGSSSCFYLWLDHLVIFLSDPSARQLLLVGGAQGACRGNLFSHISALFSYNRGFQVSVDSDIDYMAVFDCMKMPRYSFLSMTHSLSPKDMKLYTLFVTITARFLFVKQSVGGITSEQLIA